MSKFPGWLTAAYPQSQIFCADDVERCQELLGGSTAHRESLPGMVRLDVRDFAEDASTPVPNVWGVI